MKRLISACAAALCKKVDGVCLMPRDYEDHASDVWQVTAGDERLALRASRVYRPFGGFWYGLNTLYGTDPYDMDGLVMNFEAVTAAGGFAAPALRGRFLLDGREHLLLEWVEGAAPPELNEMDDGLLRRYGRALALTHRRAFPGYGHVRQLRDGADYHARMAWVMEDMMARHPDRCTLYGPIVEQMAPVAAALPPPGRFALTMPDQFPSQYMVSGDTLTIIDAETCVAAPPQMDLLVLEQQMDTRRAAVFAQGYRSVAPLPPLAAVRPAYRAFLLAMEVLGVMDATEWMEREPLLGE